MPVSLLLVEGTLDAEVLGAILAGVPPVQIGGAKGSLHHRAKQMRDDGNREAGYVRDRDFDFDPPADCSRPVDDVPRFNLQLGWRWCRHEIESYLIEPALVSKAMGWSDQEFASELVAAAKRIRHYQIARWVVGTARRSLPPRYELTTRPIDFGKAEFRLPADLSEIATREWAETHVARFFRRVEEGLKSSAISSGFGDRLRSLTESLFDSPAEAILWCSGKDLLTALEPWLTQRAETPGTLRGRLRDWVRTNPDTGLELIPEWRELRVLCRE